MEKIKKISYDDVVEVIKTELAKDKARNELHEIIAGVLAKWEGKKITARIKTQIQEALPNATVMYEPPAQFSGKVTIYGMPVHETYSDRISFYLRVTHTAAGFEDDNRSSGRAAVERIERRQEMLRNSLTIRELADKINQLNQARAEVDHLIEAFDNDKYAIERFSGLRDDRNRLY